MDGTQLYLWFLGIFTLFSLSLLLLLLLFGLLSMIVTLFSGFFFYYVAKSFAFSDSLFNYVDYESDCCPNLLTETVLEIYSRSTERTYYEVSVLADVDST